MRRTTHEHSTLELPFPESTYRFLQDNFGREIEVAPTRESGRYRLRTGSFVGSIVGPEFELHIRPKCGTTNLFFLLTYAYRLADVRKELVAHEEVDDIREFLLEILAGKLEDLIRLGLRRDYIEHRDDLPAIRGRLLLNRLLRRPPGRDLTVPCEFEDFTPDVPHNQVLRYTLERIPPPREVPLQGRLRRVLKSLDSVARITFHPREIDEFVYNRLNVHYRALHQLCRLLLEGSGLEQETGVRPLSSFLINMDRVFEQFVARWLEENLPRGLSLSTQQPGRLDIGGQIHIRPDILLFRAGDPVLVADTKYTMKGEGTPGSGDAYQILAYCRALKLTSGLLVYPQDFHGPKRFRLADGANTILTCGVPLTGSVQSIERGMMKLRDHAIRLARTAKVDLLTRLSPDRVGGFARN